MSENSSIYLDYNATTPCDPRVVAAMAPYFEEIYGNPSNGLHLQGRLAARAIERARAQVAASIGAQPDEIVFTGGATESNNLAILGLARLVSTRFPRRNRIITSAVEHKSVLLPCRKLAERGCEVIVLPVDRYGQVSLDALRPVLDERVFLVSVQAANNEVGTLQPTVEIGMLAHAAGAFFHCDAAQGVGKIPVDVLKWKVDLLSLSAHKLYGPKGIGALYVRGGPSAIPLEPLVLGGGQESGMRSGTSNVPAIVGFGEACGICQEVLKSEPLALQDLRDCLEHGLVSALGAGVNGHPLRRLPNTTSLTFPGMEVDALLLSMPEVMMSTGSACNTGALEPSHVLQAIGLSRDLAESTVRASLGRFTTENQIELAIQKTVDAYSRLTKVLS